MIVIQLLLMAQGRHGMELHVMGQKQTHVKRERMDVQVVHRPVQTQQAALWIYAMELMTTATLPAPMVQKTRKSEHHVMGLIQAFVKKVPGTARLVHSCVQTQQAIM